MNKIVVPILRDGVNSMRHRCAQSSEYGAQVTKYSVFGNGIKIAATKCLGMQQVACTIMFQAGSRVEGADDLGASHVVRAASNTTGSSYSAFMKIRYLQEAGGYITCKSDRQTISYTLRCPEPVFNNLKRIFVDTAVGGCYEDHELEDRVRPIVREHLATMSPQHRLMDLIQKASFLGPLHNSHYCEPERINSLNKAQMIKFARSCIRTDVCSLGSYGLSHADTIRVAELICMQKIDKVREPVPSGYKSGFETYDLGPGATTYIAVAVPSAGLDDICNVLKMSLIACSAGVGNMMEGSHPYNKIVQEPLSNLVTSCVSDLHVFNISHQGFGIFGVAVKTEPPVAQCALFGAIRFLMDLGKLSGQDYCIGKARLKTEIAKNEERSWNVAESMAIQSAWGHKMDIGMDTFDYIDSIGPDIIQISNELACKCKYNLSIAVVGDLNSVPDYGTIQDSMK